MFRSFFNRRKLPSPRYSENHRSPFIGGQDQAFGHITYAQCGEDLYIANIFALIGKSEPSYLDVGAHHPWNGSNSALFYLSGSSGICVEPNREIIEQYRLERPRDIVLNVGVSSSPGRKPFYRIGWDSGRNSFSKSTIDAVLEEFPTSWISDADEVELWTLNQIVDQHCGGKFPDLLSIDTEGLDEEILRSTDFSRTRPVVICAEVRTGHNTDSPDNISSALKAAGFVPYARTWGNGIFLDGAVADQLRF